MSIALADCRLHVCSRLQLNFSMNQLGPEGAKALAPVLVRASLTRVNVSYNSMRDKGVKLLRDAVSGREGFELIDHRNE